MRRAAKRDANDAVLAHAAREMGARMVYAGPCDWWVGWRGQWFPVEIKNKEGKNRYTLAQRNFLKQCEVDKLPVFTWRSLEDVVKSLSRV